MKPKQLIGLIGSIVLFIGVFAPIISSSGENKESSLKEAYIKEAYNKLPAMARKRIVKIVSAYEIALNTPKFLFSQKASEAHALVNDFLVDFPLEKNNLLRLHFMLMKVSFDITPTLNDASEAYKALNELKDITGQL